MTISDVLGALRKYMWSCFAIVTVAALAAIALTMVTKPVYSATAKAFVSAQGQSSNADLLQGSSFTQQRVKSYAALVTSRIVLKPVADEAQFPGGYQALAENVSASVPLNTVTINISVTSLVAADAAKLANATAESFANAVQEMETTGEQAQSPVRVTVFQPAVEPTSPVSPKLLVNLAAGLALGLLLAVGYALLRNLFDTGIATSDDVTGVTSHSILGEIRHNDGFSESRLPVHTNPSSSVSEEFRQLRTNMMFIDSAHNTRVHIITSAVQGEGKTTISTNLALAYAHAGKKVCLVDGDLRRPNVANTLGIEGSVGLTTVLIGESPVRDVVQRWANTSLWVLPSGQQPPNPSELLGSKGMEQTIEILLEKFDVVIVDAPPLVPVTDAAILASQFKNVSVVVGCGKATKPQLQQALAKLDAVDVEPGGLIVNRVPSKHKNKYGYYDEYKQDVDLKAAEAQAVKS